MPETTDTEFEEIFEPVPGNRPVMSKPPRVIAAKKFIDDVRVALDLDGEKATDAADWIADKMERFGARTARPVFTMDGGGPLCSWCGQIWPLCGDHHLSQALQDEPDEP